MNTHKFVVGSLLAVVILSASLFALWVATAGDVQDPSHCAYDSDNTHFAECTKDRLNHYFNYGFFGNLKK